MRTRIITILSLTLILFSCHKDVNNGGGGGPNSGIMSATINGSSTWYANQGYAQSPNAYALNLYASYNNASYISISLNGGYTGPGNYILSGVGGLNTAIFYDGNGITYQSTSGTVNVTSDNGTQVMGVFNFSGPTSSGGGGGYVTVSGQFNLTR